MGPLLPKKHTSSYHWQALRLFNLYRVILSLGFLAVVLFNVDISFVGIYAKSLYEYTAFSYFFFSLLFLTLSAKTKTYYSWQANGPIFIDIIAIILLMHSSGGLVTGIGILLVVIVAAHSLLVPGRLSFLSAALAVIGLLCEQSYTILSQNISTNIYTQVGILGIVIFATSIVTNLLASRARTSQIMVENQAQLLATSQQLNAHVVSAMHAGVLVLDSHLRIRLINQAAKKLLGLNQDQLLSDINALPVAFQNCVFAWQHHGKFSPTQQMTPNGPEVRVTFHPLGKPLPVGTLIFIYNASEETRQAQDLKLASLGHLTANIAHELRNPLGAASHAAQLLAESQHLSEDDAHLLSMIKNSCDRMNEVIQNVLSLSGRKPANPQHIKLIPWLRQFIREFIAPQIQDHEILLDYEDENISLYADPSQLTQILIILCENGLRYSLQKTGQAQLCLSIKAPANADVVYIDVIDKGIGISSTIAKHIFEPFFTTEKTGSGLGLYIAKELSEMNGIRLAHIPVMEGCQFRLTVPYQEDSWQNQQPW